MMWGLARTILVLLGVLATTTSARPNAPKVDLALYYESLCPACRDFISSQLYPTFEKVGGIFNLTLVPYGNANEKKRDDKWIFDCQHGKLECIGNLIETCAIDLLKNISTSMKFVHCFEKDIVHGPKVGNPLIVAKKCAKELDIEFGPIEDCQGGALGNKLEHEMAEKTDALRPQHQYTPWITLNGKHTEKIQDKAEDNLLKLLCDTYTGPKPSACRAVRRHHRCSRKDFKDNHIKVV